MTNDMQSSNTDNKSNGIKKNIFTFLLPAFIILGLYINHKYIGDKYLFKIPEQKTAISYDDPLWQKLGSYLLQDKIALPGTDIEKSYEIVRDDTSYSIKIIRYFPDDSNRINSELISYQKDDNLIDISREGLQKELNRMTDLYQATMFTNKEIIYTLEKSDNIEEMFGYQTYRFDYIFKSPDTSKQMYRKGSLWADTADAKIIYYKELLSPIKKIFDNLLIERRYYYTGTKIDSSVYHIEITADIFIMKMKTITCRTYKDYWMYKKNPA